MDPDQKKVYVGMSTDILKNLKIVDEVVPQRTLDYVENFRSIKPYIDKYGIRLGEYKFIYNGTNYVKMPTKMVMGNEYYSFLFYKMVT